MAIMAITTNNSMRVKAILLRERLVFINFLFLTHLFNLCAGFPGRYAFNSNFHRPASLEGRKPESAFGPPTLKLVFYGIRSQTLVEPLSTAAWTCFLRLLGVTCCALPSPKPTLPLFRWTWSSQLGWVSALPVSNVVNPSPVAAPPPMML